MIWEALGALALVTIAGMGCCAIAWHKGISWGRELERMDRAERRAARRTEARASTLPARLEPFPEEWTERLATTGELRIAAETGDVDTLRRETAAFFGALNLSAWTRKKGTHAA